MTFNELENEINYFIHYYNNVRIQEKLNWMHIHNIEIIYNNKKMKFEFLSKSHVNV